MSCLKDLKYLMIKSFNQQKIRIKENFEQIVSKRLGRTIQNEPFKKCF